ncbi:MAG: ABC transporter permease [Chloroflexota bacterium]
MGQSTRLGTPPASRWQVNPIIVKELRSRMRGGRAFITLTVSLTALALCGYLLYRMTTAANQYSSTPLSPLIGQVLFFGLAFILLMVISAITPAVTAGAISGEREHETYEMLLATPLHPASILWGKLVASMGYVFLLLFSAVPLASVVFLFGGVTLRDMLKTLAVLVAVTVLFAMIGLFLSALFGRSGRATALAYLATLGVLIGPIIVAVGAGVVRQGDPPRWLLAISPVSALASAMSPSVNPNNISSMFWMLGSPIYWIMGNPPISFDSIPRPVYHYAVPAYLFVTLVLYLLASHLVRPSRRWRLEWAEVIVGAVLALGLVGLVGLGYAATANRYENILFTVEATATPQPTMTAPSGELQPSLVPEAPEGEQQATPTPAGLN